MPRRSACAGVVATLKGDQPTAQSLDQKLARLDTGIGQGAIDIGLHRGAELLVALDAVNDRAELELRLTAFRQNGFPA